MGLMARSALVIRHVAFEDLGLLAPLLAARGIATRHVEAGAEDLRGFDPLAPDLVIVLGGPVGAYERESYPFLVDEAALLERRLAADRPTLGICLGAQLMAAALGARVYSGGHKEIGWKPVTLSVAGRRSCLAGLGYAHVLHWHGDTFDLPAGAVHLAASDLYPNQAFAWGRTGLALQFHLEATDPRSLERWFIGHAAEIGAVPGLALPALRAATGRFGPVLAPLAAAVFAQWFDGIGLGEIGLLETRPTATDT